MDKSFCIFKHKCTVCFYIYWNDTHYYDGGSYSMENPDVIAEADTVIVFTTNLPIPVPYELDDLVEQMTA